MNKERLLELAAIIEHTPHKHLTLAANNDRQVEPVYFNMGTWHCGSVCCIGGWANAVFAKDQSGGAALAALLLGLDEETGDGLFFPLGSSGWHVDWEYQCVTPDMAAKVIRHLADTGTVDWSIIAVDMPVEMKTAKVAEALAEALGLA